MNSAENHIDLLEQSSAKIIVLLEKQVSLLQSKNSLLESTIVLLRNELDTLKRMIFGVKNEKFIPNSPAGSVQLSLDLNVDVIGAETISTEKVVVEKTKKKVNINHPGRNELPAHLERVVTIIDPENVTDDMVKIGEEVTESLEYKQGNLFVNRYVRTKYATSSGEAIIVAPAVERPIPKAIAGASLLAQIVTEKYVDHIPLYRQVERFKRVDVDIAMSTIADWISKTCLLIDPLYDALKKIVVAGDYLQADETPIKVLDNAKKGKTHRGYFWVYHNSIKGLTLFEYQQGRGESHPKEILKDFKGHLQVDGYAGYESFKSNADVTVLHCMAHARRKFFDAQSNDQNRCDHVLIEMSKLYAIESDAKAKHLTAIELLKLRQEAALPILTDLGKWMQAELMKVTPKSPIGKALAYSISRWKELCAYTTDAKLNIDNNPVERSIRPVAVGRKNYLFAGSHEGAKRAAMLYSFMGTCKLHNINPLKWLTDVLNRISSHPINKIEELLPHNWTPLV